MKRAALLGRDISYTLSPKIHAAIAEAVGEELTFDVFDTPYDMLGDVVNKLLSEYDGFFVTKPYKNDIKGYLKRCETNCGVNFVSCAERVGYNTDGMGFIRALDRNFAVWRGSVKSALILGAGGAAHSVADALISAGAHVYVLNRTMMTAVKLCSALGDGAELYYNQPVELVVNCTSVGLHNDDALTALCVLPDFEYAFDLIYDPPKTPFLRRCEASGAKVANGRDMLVYQAIEGDKILFGRELDTDGIFHAVNERSFGEIS